MFICCFVCFLFLLKIVEFHKLLTMFFSNCLICLTSNTTRGQDIQAPGQPFDHLQMDFIELTPCEGKKYCLVAVDMFSKWVEVFPTGKADASAVAKVLVREIIPPLGIPHNINSDNGTHFVNNQLSTFLGINLKQHCTYHPESGGAVERENGTIKNKLVKCCDDTGLSWIKALPVVLMAMRGRGRARTGLSPF